MKKKAKTRPTIVGRPSGLPVLGWKVKPKAWLKEVPVNAK